MATLPEPTRFGYTKEQWEQAVDAGVRILKDVAGAGGTISYTDLCERIFAVADVRVVPGELALAHILGAISRATLGSDECAITALVVYKGSADAGTGLYALAIEEGLLPKKPKADEKDAFRVEHMNKAYAIWHRKPLRPGERFPSE
ncbi:MAG TPA: hypothetical protein VMD59_07050 [Acidimicrobiales bacterium]|nr:hypothetical protein [Acidimicrobiales bacterium]